MIPHTPEFSPAPKPRQKREQEDRELAAAYCRLFSTEDGKRVLANLMAKYSPDRPRFFNHSDPVQAAKIDGQSDVLRDIRSAIAIGSPVTGIPTP